LRLDALEIAHRLVLRRLALDLAQLVGEQAALTEQVGGSGQVGRGERPVELETLGVDRGVGEGGHQAGPGSKAEVSEKSSGLPVAARSRTITVTYRSFHVPLDRK